MGCERLPAGNLIDGTDGMIAECGFGVRDDSEYARRLVACWNVLRGVETEELEAIVNCRHYLLRFKKLTIAIGKAADAPMLPSEKEPA